MTRSTEPLRPPESLPESSIRPEVTQARTQLREDTRRNPGPVQRTLRNTIFRPSVLFMLGVAGVAGYLAWYFRNAGDRVPITPYMADAARAARAVAPLTTVPRPLTPAPEFRRAH